MKIWISLLLMICLLQTSWAQSSIFAYQGYLTDPNDQPITASKQVTFRLYRQIENGSPLWSEEHLLNVDQGFFNVNLGMMTALSSNFAFDQDLYLGVQIEDDLEMRPRILIAPALKAKWAERSEVAVRSDVAEHAIDVANENIHPQSVSVGDRMVIDSQGRWVGEPISGLTGPQGPRGEQGVPGVQGPRGEQGPPGDVGSPCTVRPLIQTNGEALSGVVVLKCGDQPEIRLSTYQCGNGQIDQGEICDDGNWDINDGCDSQCRNECGNGVLNTGEICDDGNFVNTDSCTNICHSAQCGDGIVQMGIEQCDDRNMINNDECMNNCQFNKPCGVNCPVIEMILIRAGSFNMGSNGNSAEQPVHNVQIRTDFYVGKTEVTVGQYRTCVNAGVCTVPDDTANSIHCNWTNIVGSKETHPVNCIDWNQARRFAKWIGGDLLTEAQWEYIATGQGQSITYPWGNATSTCQLANYSGCIGTTAPVCSLIEGNTTQGVCDMGGNVWEWMLDEWHGSYNGAPINEQAWCGDIGVCNTNTSVSRVRRSGCWADYASNTSRGISTPSSRGDYLGFRVSSTSP